MGTRSEEHPLHSLVSLSKTLLENRLTPNKKSVIESIETGKTFSQLVRDIEKEKEVSKATVRRTLQMLRDLKLVRCGSSEERGRPLEITDTGELILEEVKL
jgi:Fe2+ or Zn2+ uptake regulation protein